MNDSPEQIAASLRGHIGIAVAVLMLLALSIGLVRMGVDGNQRTAAVLGVAAVQVFLIAAILMHLMSERRGIIAVVLFTIVFVAGLFGLTYLTMNDPYEGAEHVVAPSPDDGVGEEH